jgi:multidrug efflux pump subunit AcrA (membrane-fusion protein)
MIDVNPVKNAQLKPGMSATVEIVTDQLRDVLYVPIQTVVSYKSQHYVYMIKRGRKHLTDVQIGKYNTQYIEITDGLNEGDELLLYGEVEMEADARLKKSPLSEKSDNGDTEEAE